MILQDLNWQCKLQDMEISAMKNKTVTFQGNHKVMVMTVIWRERSGQIHMFTYLWASAANKDNSNILLPNIWKKTFYKTNGERQNKPFWTTNKERHTVDISTVISQLTELYASKFLMSWCRLGISLCVWAWVWVHTCVCAHACTCDSTHAASVMLLLPWLSLLW